MTAKFVCYVRRLQDSPGAACVGRARMPRFEARDGARYILGTATSDGTPRLPDPRSRQQLVDSRWHPKHRAYRLRSDCGVCCGPAPPSNGCIYHGCCQQQRGVARARDYSSYIPFAAATHTVACTKSRWGCPILANTVGSGSTIPTTRRRQGSALPWSRCS